VKPGARRRRAGQVAAAVFAVGTAEDIGAGPEPDVRTKPSETAATTTSGTAANNAQRSTPEWYAQRLS
jgi:hypothetical protein